MLKQIKKIETDKCPFCKKEMDLLYNDFFTCNLLGIYEEIRGQYCDNKKCKGYGIERRHPRDGEQITKEEHNWLIKC